MKTFGSSLGGSFDLAFEVGIDEKPLSTSSMTMILPINISHLLRNRALRWSLVGMNAFRVEPERYWLGGPFRRPFGAVPRSYTEPIKHPNALLMANERRSDRGFRRRKGDRETPIRAIYHVALI